MKVKCLPARKARKPTEPTESQLWWPMSIRPVWGRAEMRGSLKLIGRQPSQTDERETEWDPLNKWRWSTTEERELKPAVFMHTRLYWQLHIPQTYTTHATHIHTHTMQTPSSPVPIQTHNPSTQRQRLDHQSVTHSHLSLATSLKSTETTRDHALPQQ